MPPKDIILEIKQMVESIVTDTPPIKEEAILGIKQGLLDLFNQTTGQTVSFLSMQKMSAYEITISPIQFSSAINQPVI